MTPPRKGREYYLSVFICRTSLHPLTLVKWEAKKRGQGRNNQAWEMTFPGQVCVCVCVDVGQVYDICKGHHNAAVVGRAIFSRCPRKSSASSKKHSPKDRNVVWQIEGRPTVAVADELPEEMTAAGRIFGGFFSLHSVHPEETPGMEGKCGKHRATLSWLVPELACGAAKPKGFGAGRFLFMTPHLFRCRRNVTYSARALIWHNASTIHWLCRVIMGGWRKVLALIFDNLWVLANFVFWNVQRCWNGVFVQVQFRTRKHRGIKFSVVVVLSWRK